VRKLIWIVLTVPFLVGCVLFLPRPTEGVPMPAPTHTPTLAPTSTPSPTPTALTPGIDWADLSPYRAAMRPAFVGDIDGVTDATRYWIELDIDLAALTLDGTALVNYTNQENEPLDEIVFRLLPNTPGYGASMTVSRVTVGETVVAPTVRLGGSAIHVPLSAPLAPGERIEVALSFSGDLPTDRSAGYAQYGYVDGVLALPNAYPLIPVYDDEGWNVEVAPSHGDATFSDTALYHVRVRVPSDMVVACSGVAIDAQPASNGTTAHTCASGPMRDFVVVASAAYQRVSAQVGEVTVHSYYLDERAGGERALDYAVEALRAYEQLLGPYPFTELDVVATPTTAGGIEYPGLVVIAANLYTRNGGFFELATVHEVAHQWWYGLVGNDQVDEPWLDEALTQYTSLLYYEERYGAERAEQFLEETFENPYHYLCENDLDMPAGLPVAAYSSDLYGAVVYGKGPLFFHALRQQVGDQTFRRILQTYLQEHRYGVAYPKDFISVAERVSGQSLDALYARWIGQN